jgi:hypothetical protein
MSQEQLKKFIAEKEMLQREEKLLNEAIQPEEASEKIIIFTSKAQDPFNSPDNEWTKVGDGPGCCSIM